MRSLEPSTTLAATSIIRENLQAIEANNQTLAKQMGNTQRKIMTAFTRDKRKSGHWNNVQVVISELIWAGLQSIPYYGGYFALAKKVLQDPIKGLHHISRTSYGSGSMNGAAWNLFGDSNNGVMSPLGPGDKNFNYANGRIGAFNDDPRLRMEQLESDISDMVNTSSLYGVNYGKDMSSSSTKVKFEIDQQKMSQVYTEWRKNVLSMLTMSDEDDWIWYIMAKCVQSMRGEHEGQSDLDFGVFRIGEGDKVHLANHTDMKTIKKTYKKSSRYSNLHIVLSNYERPSYDPGFVWRDRNGKHHQLLDAETIYRVESEKALIVAYQSEVRNSLAEAVSHHLHQIISDNAGRSRLSRYHDQHKSRMKTDRILNNVGIGIMSPFRLLGVVMPKGIYNCKTTFESKKYARFLCAISVFYSILGAYYDKQFVCDELPSARSLRFFVWAFADAYNTAMEYFCHSSNTTINKRADTASLLHNTLWSLLQTDPGINTYLASVVDYKFSMKNYGATPPGLQGFKHLKASVKHGVDLVGKLSTDRYRNDKSKPLIWWKEQIEAIQQHRRELLEQERINLKELQSIKLSSITKKADFAAPAKDALIRSKVGVPATVESIYMKTLDTAMQSASLTPEVQAHFVSIHKLLLKLGAL